MANPTSKNHPLGPQVKVVVTPENIAIGVRSHSGHCMISEAVRQAFPTAKFVASDIQTIRFTDPERGLRYVYLTPRCAQKALLDFDGGYNPEPFAFMLKKAHVSRAGHRQTGAAVQSASRVTKKAEFVGNHHTATKLPIEEQKSGFNMPTIVGGRRAPRLRLRREFGLRAFRGWDQVKETAPEADAKQPDPTE